MAENPFQSMLNPNAARAGLWDMRMMAAANRSESPFERGMRSSYGNRGVSGDPMLAGLANMANEPDYSQFTYDPVMRQRAMDAGVQPLEASQVKQNVLLPNTGFFGNHPRLAGALEGGIFGAAASHGGMTTGESIQGALEGMIGGQRIRQGMQRQQFARPFEAAGMLEGLADQKQRRELQAADIEHLRSVNEHLKSGDEEKAQRDMATQRHQEAMEAMGFQRIEAQAPRNLGGGLYGYYNPGGTGPNQKGEWSIQENPEARLARSQAGAGPWYSFKDKTGKTVYGRVHEGATVPEGAKLVQGDYATKQQDRSNAARDKWIKDHAEVGAKSASTWMAAGISPGDKDAEKKLGAYYDSNIAPYLSQTSEGQSQGPQIGTVENGYRYNGGDPGDPNSWSKQ